MRCRKKTSQYWQPCWATILALSLVGLPAYAIDLNYDSLSSLEEPLAVELGDTTFLLSGLLDLATTDSDQLPSDQFVRGNFQVNAETQLPNSWTLGASYFGAYSGAELERDDYLDNAALYLGGVWGTFAIGNVTAQVDEQTRRRRGAGNAVLAYQEFLGGLEEYGVSYQTRFGPSQIFIAADEEGNYEVGGSYQRPLGNKDYRFSLRFHDSNTRLEEHGVDLDSMGIGLVAELTYGSTVLDFAFGIEQLSLPQVDAERAFTSAGASRKWGLWTASIEAHYGEFEEQDETAYALGLSYDLARGASLNLGLNYRDSVGPVNGLDELGGLVISAGSQTEGTLSFRYSF